MIKYLLLFFMTGTVFAESPFVEVTDYGKGTHSGVVISTGDKIRVLTCAHMHMFEKSKHLNVNFYQNDNSLVYISLPAKILRYNHEMDLMLLEVDNVANINIVPVSIAREMGQNCEARGRIVRKFTFYPLIKKDGMTITSINNYKLQSFYNRGMSGMSGAAIIYNGNLVSIQQSRGPTTTTGAHLDTIKDFLNE